jgi:hypothetical protein
LFDQLELALLVVLDVLRGPGSTPSAETLVTISLPGSCAYAPAGFADDVRRHL